MNFFPPYIWWIKSYFSLRMANKYFFAAISVFFFNMHDCKEIPPEQK